MATELDIIINAKDKTQAGLNSVSGGLSSFRKNLENSADSLRSIRNTAGIAFGAIAAIGVTSLTAFADAEADMAQANQTLENSLKSMTKQQIASGTGFKEMSGALETLKTEMKNTGDAAVKLAFDDEEAAKSFARLFQVTKDTKQAQKEIAIAMDLARAKGISLEDATQKLIMAHSGQTRELKALGIAVDEGATALENIDAIGAQVAGNAQAYASTTKGAWETLKIQFSNLRETVGGALQPAFAKLLEAIAPIIEKFAAWAERNPELLAKIILIAGAVTGFVAALATLGLALNGISLAFTILLSPVGLIIAAIAALAALAFLVITNWEPIKEFFLNLWTSIQEFVMARITAIRDFMVGMFTAIKEFFVGIWTSIKDFFKGIWDGMVQMVEDAVNKILDFLKPVLDFVNKIIAGIERAISFVGSKLGGKSKSVKDAVISPSGDVVSTSPNDWLIATQNPAALGMGATGGGIIINLNGGTFLDPNVAQDIGDMILQKLYLNMRGA